METSMHSPANGVRVDIAADKNTEIEPVKDEKSAKLEA